MQSILRHIFTTPRSSDKEHAFLSYEIVPMGSETMKDKVANFCESINMKYGFILDRDAYIKAEEGYIISIDEYPAYVPRTGKLRDLRFNDLSEQLKREKKPFLWKGGDLEDFLLSCFNAIDDIAMVLELEGVYYTKNDLKNCNKVEFK